MKKTQKTDMEIIREFVESVDRTPAQIEKFFGLRVVEDKGSKKDNRYNIYKASGELLFDNKYPWEISSILRGFAEKFAEELRKN